MIEDYSKNREKFISKGKGNDFKLAIQQMDEYISDPTVWIIQDFYRIKFLNLFTFYHLI